MKLDMVPHALVNAREHFMNMALDALGDEVKYLCKLLSN
jgi:hypothetical protein